MQSAANRGFEWGNFQYQLLNHVNKIFKPLGMPGVHQIQMKVGNVMQIHLDTSPQTPISIRQLGTGISQLFIILSILIRKHADPLIVCIEEPESNLHPGLLRRFIDQLRTFKNAQFIFTTHSHVLLDCLEKSDRVFRLNQREDGSCGLVLCDGIKDQHFLLDALGIRASSLLQTNCVIWIEGPSDRLYIRQWLKEAAPDLQEGRDFTFNYYGGALLAHLEMKPQDELTKDFVSMLWISRFAIVVMDRDLAPEELDDKLAPRKKPIRTSADTDTIHRLAVVTTGRDIENDIPKELLLKACSEIIEIEYDKIKNADIKGNDGFEHEIVAALCETDADLVRKMTRKLSDKIAIAMKVVGMCDGNDTKLSPPSYVKDMVELIRRSEAIEPLSKSDFGGLFNQSYG